MKILKQLVFLFSLIPILGVTQTIDDNRYKGINVGHETRVLESEINTKQYKLYINLPAHYKEHTDKSYPVFYMLDGQWDFATMVSIYGSLSYDRLIPDFIIVGISYAGDDPDYGRLRANDFTPTVLPNINNTGDAAQFTNVLRKEIIPFINDNYRTSPKNRTLAGTSFAGLYTHYVLFNANDLFSNYIICNPTYWYDNELPYKHESDYYKIHKRLDANVYLVSGSLDDVDRHNRMAKQIDSRAYKGLNFKDNIVEGFGHSSAKADGYSRGVLHSFAIKKVKLPKEELERYTGVYEIAPGQEVSIIIHNEHLAIDSFNGATNIPVYATADDSFSLQGSFRAFEFNTDAQGDITSLTVEVHNNTMHTLKKLE